MSSSAPVSVHGLGPPSLNGRCLLDSTSHFFSHWIRRSEHKAGCCLTIVRDARTTRCTYSQFPRRLVTLGMTILFTFKVVGV